MVKMLGNVEGVLLFFCLMLLTIVFFERAALSSIRYPGLHIDERNKIERVHLKIESE